MKGLIKRNLIASIIFVIFSFMNEQPQSSDFNYSLKSVCRTYEAEIRKNKSSRMNKTLLDKYESAKKQESKKLIRPKESQKHRRMKTLNG